MERKEFLSLLSGASASMLMMGCLGSCIKKDDPDMQPNQPGSGPSTKKISPLTKRRPVMLVLKQKAMH